MAGLPNQTYSYPDIKSWDTGTVETSATGATYVALPDNAALEVMISNSSGVSIDLRKSGTSSSPLIIPAGAGISIKLSATTSEVSIRRSDVDNEQVSVSFLYSNY